MVFMGLLMNMLDKIDESRDAAIDQMIARTTYYGLDGKTNHPGTPSWGMVYESLRRSEHGRSEEGQAEESKRHAKKAGS
jgi:hypothetical protein